jgi:uncharacterized membrane protein HdeD (DUF308 family)
VAINPACRRTIETRSSLVPIIRPIAVRHRLRGADMTTPRSGSSRPGATPASEPQAPIPRQQGPAPAGRDATGRPGQPDQDGGPGGPGGSGSHAGVGVADRTAEEHPVVRTFEPLGSRAWLAVLTAAVATLAVGVILLAWPRATLVIVAILLGAGLVISGLYRLVEGFTARDTSGGMRAAYVVIGLLAILVGLYCLRHRDVTIFLLALLVGAFWVVHGVADVAVAATSGPMPGRAFRLVAGLFGIAAGCIVLFWPAISLMVLLTVLGIWLICYALVLAGLAFGLRRSIKKSQTRRAAFA